MYNSSCYEHIRWLESFLYKGPEPILPRGAEPSMPHRLQKRARSDLETEADREVWYTLIYDPVAERVERVFSEQKADK